MFSGYQRTSAQHIQQMNTLLFVYDDLYARMQWICYFEGMSLIYLWPIRNAFSFLQ